MRWLVDVGLLEKHEAVDAATVGSGDDVLFVPALAGLAAPWWRSDATASFSGVTLSTSRADLVGSVLARGRGPGGRPARRGGGRRRQAVSRLRVDGGLTRSRALMQAQADLAQVPVDQVPVARRHALEPRRRRASGSTPRRRWARSAAKPVGHVQPQWPADRAAAEHLERWRDAVRLACRSRA
ncbi:MAG: hypothetical protein U0S36_12150 [Candidatus Nanopelagicales bacterium]